MDLVVPAATLQEDAVPAPYIFRAKAGPISGVSFGGKYTPKVGKKKHLLSSSGFKIVFGDFDQCPTWKILIIHF